jgi:hypothetical protein
LQCGFLAPSLLRSFTSIGNFTRIVFLPFPPSFVCHWTLWLQGRIAFNFDSPIKFTFRSSFKTFVISIFGVIPNSMVRLLHLRFSLSYNKCFKRYT